MRKPDVVIVGAATRDLNDEVPRGWLLGGGVTYGALALARLGVRTGVLLGLDDDARTAPELDLIRDAGAEIVEVPLAKGPVFRNTETLAGRVQTCDGPSDPVPVAALPDALARTCAPGCWRRWPARSTTSGRARHPPMPAWPWPGRASCATWSPASACDPWSQGHHRSCVGRTSWP